MPDSMNPITVLSCTWSTIAPSRVLGSSGSPGAMDLPISTIFSSIASFTDSCTTRREAAEHISPWLKKIPNAAAVAARSTSATSPSTTFGALPPHSSQTRFMLDLPEYSSMRLPVRVEPVKATQSTSMCRASDSPAVAPKPGTTFSTPSGSPASIASSATRSAVNGDFSEGFSTIELPVASAGPSFHDAIRSGKFHGTMAATTPIDSRVMSASASCEVGATSSYTLSVASAYQAMQLAAAGMSTFIESEIGLPMSSVSVSASSSRCLRMSSAKRSSTFLRAAGARRDQAPPSNALRALATARSTSGAPQDATFAMTWPLAGLTQSKVAPETAGRYAPSMKACVRGVSALASARQSTAFCSRVTVLSSQSRWARGADDLTALAPAIAEAVRHRTREIIGVPGPEDAGLGADRDLDLARHDDAPFLARVPQHVGARVGARFVGLAQDREPPAWPVGRDQAQ